MMRVRIAGMLVVACAATAVAADAASPRAKLFADLGAETQAVRQDACDRLEAAPDVTDVELRAAIAKADGVAKALLLHVAAAKRMTSLTPEAVAALESPDPTVSDAAARALVGLGAEAAAAGLSALRAATDPDVVETRVHLEALAAQRAVERGILGRWRRKGGTYKGRYSSLAELGWPVQPVLLAMLLDVPLCDHHLVLPESDDAGVVARAKFASLVDLLLSDRRGYATFEPLPQQIESDEMFDLAYQALIDVADIGLMGRILTVVSERLEEVDGQRWRPRRPEQFYFRNIDEILWTHGRTARLERLGRRLEADVKRAKTWVDEGETRAEVIGRLSNALSEYATVLHKLARYDEAAQCFSEVIRYGREFGDKDPAIAGYNRACALAQGGRKDEALKQLARCLDRNLSSGSEDLTREWVTEDGDLAPLHDDPRFQALIKRRYDE